MIDVIMADPLILARGFHFAMTVLASGTICFMTLVAEPAARAPGSQTLAGYAALRRQLTLLAALALILTVLSGAVWLALVGAGILGVPLANIWLDGGIWTVASETQFGRIACARLIMAGVLGLLLAWPPTRWLQLLAGAGLVALIAPSGHAGATPGVTGAIQLISDGFHLLAAGAWLGGLPALVLLLGWSRHGAGPDRVTVAVNATNRFSILGIVCVLTLVASGTVNSWVLLSGPRDLIATTYGRVLLLKIGLFAAMLGIAAVNRFCVTPRLTEPGAARALQLNSLVLRPGFETPG